MKPPKSHQIRITAGIFRGRKIKCPPGEIRPMTARVKEALFSILGDIEGIKMLDLFSGSGNISIEAFSRGIAESDIVEKDPGKRATIESNLEKMGITGARVNISDVFSFIRRCRKQYDLIMVDPPYKMPNKEEIIRLISEKGLLAPGGICIMQLPRTYEIEPKIGTFINYDRRTYGLNTLLFYHEVEGE